MDRRLLAAAYDRSAGGYDERFRDLQRPKFRAAAAFMQPPAGSLCVDAGGGTALLLEWARDEQPRMLEARWLLIDISAAMLRLARPRTALVALADVGRPPLKRASCALVCAFTSVLDQAEKTLRELASITAAGGTLVVSFLKAEAPRELPLRVLHSADAGQDRVFILKKE